MRSFEDLVSEAAAADVTGWGFDWLDGRATEERPPWGFSGLLADHLAQARCAMDLDTGGGEVLAEASTWPRRMVATEAWPPNARRAQARLGPRGGQVIGCTADRLPFADGAFDLVTARHPVRPDWVEVHRVLAPGGVYLGQHVGPASAFELIEFFLGPLPENVRAGRDPASEAAGAKDAGLSVTDLRTARCRMEFRDVGAVVWTLRKCVWWVPDFTVERYQHHLRALDRQFRAGAPFIAHSTRQLIVARKE